MASGQESKNCRIIVIDDSSDIHSDFQKILCDAGSSGEWIDEEASLVLGKTIPSQSTPFTLTSAFQGQEGVERVVEALRSHDPFAVAFVDMRMPPGWDGLTTIKRLWEVDPRLEIVLCTAYSDRSWEEIVTTLGPTDQLLILKKPFDVVEVLQTASTLTQKWNLARQAETTAMEREARLGDVEMRFRLAFENSGLGMALMGLDGKFLMVNPSLTRMFGYSDQEFLKLDCETITYSIDWVTESDFIHDMLAGKTSTYSIEKRCLRKDNHEIIVQLDVSLIPESHRSPAYFVGQFQDITEKRRAEQLVRRSQRLESIGSLAGGIAHDLNNSLAPILISTEWLRLTYPDKKDAIDIIERSARRGAELVAHLLAFSKGAEGAREPILMTEIVDEVITMVQCTFPSHIEVSVRLDSELPDVVGDRTQLYQLLLNLCVNARDAMPDGGCLTIEGERVTLNSEDIDPLTEATPGTFLKISVCDSGIGISKENLERVFDPYFTTKGPDQGTGLGLSTSAAVVKGHGGFIQVASEDHKGTTFAIHLPTERQGVETKTAAVPVAPARFRGSGQVVLLVDDESDVLEMTSLILSTLGLVPLKSSDGAQAISVATQERDRIRVVITDLDMPKFDGIRLIETLQQMLPGVPIVAISGKIDAEQDASLTQMGIANRLQKPFSQASLEAVLGGLPGLDRDSQEQNFH